MSIIIKDFEKVTNPNPPINPTWLYYTTKYNNGTATQTIDPTKSYVIFSSKHTDTGSETSDIWSIVKGVLTQIRSASSSGSVTLNGTTVTFKGTSGDRWTVFELIQLD